MENDKLRLLRLMKRISQERLARRAGISQTILSRIERGDREASDAEARAIARVLDAPVDLVFPAKKSGTSKRSA